MKSSREGAIYMTGQINGVFAFRGQVFDIVEVRDGKLFDPSALGLEPTAPCTACWQGYVAKFALVESCVVMDTLYINLVKAGQRYLREIGPIINGVEPMGPHGKEDWFNNRYENLAYRLNYTGSLMLGKGFIKNLYVHMGFQSLWKYENVLELVFESGILKKELDRSRQMAGIRKLAIREKGNDEDNIPF
jgi:hypothetical protein